MIRREGPPPEAEEIERLKRQLEGIEPWTRRDQIISDLTRRWHDPAKAAAMADKHLAWEADEQRRAAA